MNLKIFSIYAALSFVASPLLCPDYVQAQVLSDETLPVPTRVTQSSNVFEIQGGTEAGNNLFHSFETFSIQDNETVQFINNNTSIQNIIGRITGTSQSQIFGNISTGGTSTNVNLFLINPNGIIFGPQSSLNINGSFVATAANSLQFGNEGSFGPSTGNDPSLLKVNPSAFFFNQARSQSIVNGSIVNRSTTGLAVPNNNSILLLGGNIEIDRGILNAPNGRIELGGLLEPGTVLLNMNQGIFSSVFPDNVVRSNVSLTNESLVDVTDKGSGSVNIFAQNIILSGTSSIRAGISSELPSDTNNPGAIVLNATGTVTFKDIDSGILNLAGFAATGNSGDIIIISESFNMESLSGIVSYTFGDGNSGNVILNVRRGITISGSNEETSTLIASAIAPGGKGNSGDIIIQAGSFSLSDGAGIRSSVFGEGNNGNISIHVDDDFSIENSTNYTSEIRTAVESGAVGNAGDIDIRARTISLNSGGQISSFVSGPSNDRQGGKGNGGNIDFSASDSFSISGANFGDSNVRSGIFANTEEEASGISGSVVINTTSFILDKGAEIQLSNPQGQAGNLTVNTNFMTLNSGNISATTGGNGSSSSANINLNVSNYLRLDNESTISATATQNENGGNIRIDVPILLAFPSTGNGSDIVASAEFGRGGNIKINAQGVFGIEQSKAFDGNQTNDFDASSQFGSSGQVQINTTTDVNKGLVELPTTVLDPNTIVSQHPCDRGWNSSFALKGRGGNPPTPRQDLSAEAVQVGLVEPAPMDQKRAVMVSNQASLAPSFTSQQNATEEKIVPAQGWVYNNKGEVLLVAYNPTLSSTQRLIQNPTCPVQ